MITVAGVLTLLLAVVLGIQSLVKYFCGHALEGFTTVISASSDYRQPHHAEPWRHRNLYCEDLRGSQGKTAVFYREKDQRQEKKTI